ncbi:MAG TPA: TadE family protein [Candidatus Dormibacteraeota bacterium]|nr:TadE family protein [Candidatus Dormibacteraeota bacterium]
MKRRRRQSGQALIEYAFLMVLLATITFAVVILAGAQLQGAFNDVTYEFNHLTDTSTLAPDGTTILSPGVTPGAGSCESGQHSELRGHKWKCRQDN